MSYLMLDIEGTTLQADEADVLQHPAVGGLILFSRNYQHRQQLNELIAAIRAVKPEIIIAVDHEGGRVQRFRDGFTQIPAMGDILPAAKDLAEAQRWAKSLGFLMATELLACDIDLSFAPVLDLNGVSEVIGTRSFSAKPDEVIALASAFIDGMAQTGMAAVGKHFPGHGSVVADTHHASAIDPRELAAISAQDMLPFKQLINEQKVQGIMPAHVIYSAVDNQPAGFSEFWLQQVLRHQLNFNGVIFSDDLGMKGAAVAGDYRARAHAALNAGCNMVLVCNDPQGARSLLNDFDWPTADNALFAALKPDPLKVMQALENEPEWQRAIAIVQQIRAA
ncbi:beta-N-acetylhexosaminidase [Shewanella avicenniae]|uniref:Beta-hexosaminidase n=1 Tax=Shewanella avicenniae TaxID=2814294 RepID=A0ABX7QN67_9GAMM|nr:beta-N-acetylhexosaminidase [Shewanella avicenniae]QSX32411.1 beta-N-acetylhexosaminidase [Shewanella avicenniae]